MRKAIITTILTLIVSYATAQETSPSLRDTLSAPTLREAVVNARRDPQGITAAQTLSGQQLSRMNQYSVADAVRFFSGVQLKDYGGIGGLKTINVRAMGTEHTAVSYNGVQIFSAQNGIVDLGRYSLSNIGGITLSSGGNGETLKPASMFAPASMVEILPREPQFNGRPFNLRATLSGGSFGTFTPDVLWEQKLSDKIALQLNAAWLTSTGRYKYRYHLDGGYDTTATRHNGDITVLRGEAALYGKMRGGSWNARGYVYSSRRGLPGAIVRNRLSHIDRQRDLNSFLQGSARKRWGHYAMLLNAKLSYDYLHYLYDPRRDQGSMYVNNHYHQSSAYVSAAHKYTFSEHLSASLATDYRLDILNADLRNFAKPLRHTFYVSAAADSRLGDLRLQATALMTYADNRTRGEGKNSSHLGLTPAVFASWQPGTFHNLTLRAFYKRSYRVPTFNDLYYTFIGNASLKPEYASQVDVGADWKLPFGRRERNFIALKADAYINNVSNKIIAVPAANQFRWTMTNLGRVAVHGADAGAEAALSLGKVGLNAKINYSWQRAMDRSDKSSPYYEGQIAYIPEHSLSAVAAVAWGLWSMDYSFLYTGQRYDSSANIPANRIRPYYIHDAALNRDLSFWDVKARLSLAVNNILNRHYDVVRCYPMPGRNYKITLLLNI